MQRTDWWLPEVRDGGWEKCMKVLKRYKLTKQMTHGDIMYSMVTIIIAYLKVTKRRIDLKISHQKNKKKLMDGNNVN